MPEQDEVSKVTITLTGQQAEHTLTALLWDAIRGGGFIETTTSADYSTSQGRVIRRFQKVHDRGDIEHNIAVHAIALIDAIERKARQGPIPI